MVVVNHALLFQTLLQGKDDLASLPIEKVIVDEAHNLAKRPTPRSGVKSACRVCGR